MAAEVYGACEQLDTQDRTFLFFLFWGGESSLVALLFKCILLSVGHRKGSRVPVGRGRGRDEPVELETADGPGAKVGLNDDVVLRLAARPTPKTFKPSAHHGATPSVYLWSRGAGYGSQGLEGGRRERGQGQWERDPSARRCRA